MNPFSQQDINPQAPKFADSAGAIPIHDHEKCPVILSVDDKPARLDKHQIPSDISILFFSTVSGFVALAVVLWLQWLIYNDWLHRGGPLRIVGSVLAGVLTFVFVSHWQSAIRERKIEMLRRFETIQQMNDRIRNALQVIECATYATNPRATEPVRNAVDIIAEVLQEVLVEAHPAFPAASAKSAADPKPIANQKSA